MAFLSRPDVDRTYESLQEAIAELDLDAIQEHWEALDQWLSYAGLLPHQWIDAKGRSAGGR